MRASLHQNGASVDKQILFLATGDGLIKRGQKPATFVNVK
jgi:hypothetical protein